MKQQFTFTREELLRVLEGTINLYVEYIDKYGKEKSLAAIHATLETVEGLSVTDEELQEAFESEVTT